MSLLFNMLSRLVIAFLPRGKHLLISWLQSPSAVILGPPKIKSVTVSTVSPSICHEMMGPDAMILVFWILSFKPALSLSYFTFIKRFFSSSLSAGWQYTALKYSFPNGEPFHFSMSGSNCCFLTCIQISQETGKVVWFSHILKNFPQFVVIHMVKGFGIVNKADVDVFLKLSFFLHDPGDAGNLISGSSAFLKSNLNIWAPLRRSHHTGRCSSFQKNLTVHAGS